MLRHLSLRDFVIVRALDLDASRGFSVLTGETGAGKSILIDALQLALGGRGDAAMVREGALRTDIAATFDAPMSLAAWLDEAGFAGEDNATLILRRSIDNQGRSRAWINGITATATQLREAADHLVDIHGQHAWQSLTRPAAVRALLDEQAGVDTGPLLRHWQAWQQAQRQLDLASTHASERERERERLTWQITEVDKLNPGANEWPDLNDEHKRLSHAQALIDAAQLASQAIAEADDNAESLTARASDALADLVDVDARLQPALDALRGAQAQLSDAAHTLRGYLQHADVDPARLSQLDDRLSQWMGLARRLKITPAELGVQRQTWQAALVSLDAASNLEALGQAVSSAKQAFTAEAKRVSHARGQAAPVLAQGVTAAMQHLGMGGGRFDVQLSKLEAPQSYGMESVEFLVAGHAGSTPRSVGKVASGGELSRLALAVAITGCRQQGRKSASASNGVAPDTLIFDEIDAGVGGAVAQTVGQLMRELGRTRQVLAVTHLAQVAAHADAHFVVSKTAPAGKKGSASAPTESEVRRLDDDAARVAEVARMLGGTALGTATAHAREMVEGARLVNTTAAAPELGKMAAKRAKPARKVA
jgi:DNA repair protein RecN (Recombination protein N)